MLESFEESMGMRIQLWRDIALDGIEERGRMSDLASNGLRIRKWRKHANWGMALRAIAAG
jgi:hypothetical protein